MEDVLARLGDKGYFCDLVMRHFKTVPPEATDFFTCQNTVAADRVELAYDKYIGHIKSMSVLLHSQNPDHYKRSGALLHSLHKSHVVTEVTWGDSEFGSIEEVEGGECLGISYGDAKYMVEFPAFYREYFNELMAFNLAFRCCSIYEEHKKEYNFEYLHNVCHYLANNNLCLDSCSMLLRSLMQ